MCNRAARSTAQLLLLSTFLLTFGQPSHAIVCSYKGERHNDGDRWVVRSTFVMECHVFPDGSWRADIVACQTPRGTEMHNGDELFEDEVKYQCLRMPSGAYRIQRQYIIRNLSCSGHAVGEWWISNRNFNKTCTPMGTHIVNCLTDAGIPFGLNSSIVLSGIRYSCVAHDNGTVTMMREHSRNFGMGSRSRTIHCTVDGVQKKPGETWIENANFLKKCDDNGGIVIEACIAEGSIIDLNTNVTHNGKMYFCTKNNDGTVLFRIIPVTDNGTRL